MPNGTQTIYTYDPASQVTNILHQIAATSAQINKADYAYNTVGNRTSLTDRRGTQSFGYDGLDRLTAATHPLTLDQSFAYDPVGNRTTNSSQHNGGNQLTEDTGFTYQYDANGNLTRKTVKASGVHTDYTYDAENRLIKVEEFAAGATVPAATATYRYDGLGRRIEKIGNGLTRRYIYDGEDILLEYDETNTLQARYTHGPGIDEPLAMTRGSNTFFYHQDGLGTVTDLTDSTGQTAKTYSYDAWGQIIQQTGTVESPYTYTGREFDVESGLYYYRARYYDPMSGRFLQVDPLGFRGGDLNLYGYVLDDPVNLVDHFGLASCTYSIHQHRLICVSNDRNRVEVLGPEGVFSGIGQCTNNPEASCTESFGRGPIPPGEYNMNPDNRPAHNKWWRLEPVPQVPGWKYYFGLARSGFLLHPGSFSLGCITTARLNPNAMKQFDRIDSLLRSESGSNVLYVTP